MAHETFVQEFCAILVKYNMIPEKEIGPLQKVFKDSEQDYFDDFLIEEGLIEPEDLLKALSLYYKVPAIDVKGLFFEHYLVTKFPRDFLERNSIIPYEIEENMLFVVASRPEISGLVSAIRDFVSYDIEFLVGLNQDIQDAIEEFYDTSPVLDALAEDLDMDEEKRMEQESMRKEEDLESLGYSEIVFPGDEESEEE